MSIGVSVGGMNNFRDGCLSNGHLKPWRNFETKVDSRNNYLYTCSKYHN